MKMSGARRKSTVASRGSWSRLQARRLEQAAGAAGGAGLGNAGVRPVHHVAREAYATEVRGVLAQSSGSAELH